MFLLLKGELENRLDANFYKNEFKELIEKIQNTKYKTVSFIEVLKSITNGYDFRDYKDFGTPYIKVANVKKGEFDFSKIQYIELKSDEITKAIQLKKGNLLLTRKGTYGNALSLDNDYNYIISSEIFYIDLKTETINSKYLEIFFNSNIGQLQFNRVSIGAIMGSLSQDVIKTLKIPLPPLENQQEIVTIYEKANAIKKANEEKAKTLLASIDNYLLAELGIILPEKVENTLKNGVFLTNINEVLGKRIDPNKYNPSTVRLSESVQKSPLSKLKLKELVIQSLAGDWGLDESDELDPNNYIKCLVIRATEFDNIYNLRLDNSRVKFRMINWAKFEKLNVQANDLLIEKSGGSEDQPVGRVAIIERSILENQQISFSNFIHKIRIDDTIVYPKYLFYYLKMIHNIKITESMQSQTNGIRNLIMSEYLNQIIVLPELQKQIDIANKIQEIKEQAKTLQNEAKTAIEEAKRIVESMILGE